MPALLYGLFASLFALIVQLVVWIPYPNIFVFHENLSLETIVALIVLACCEEFARILFFTQYALRYSLPFPIRSGLLFGIGFALTESILAVLAEKPVSLLLLGIIALHIVLSILLASTSTSYLWRPSRKAFFALIFIGLTLIHLGYNVAIYLFT